MTKYYHWFPFHPTNSEFTGDKANLKELGKNLLVVNPEEKDRQKQTDLRRISSVPDVWSQHHLFHMMLTNTATDDSYMEYGEIVIREWRAMFAVLLLAESYDVKIHMETIDFKKDAKNPYVSAAYKVRPEVNSWNSVDLYYIKDGEEKYPIAMSSPTVHIVPTKDAWEKLEKVYPGKIPWLRDGKVHALVNKAEDTEGDINGDKESAYTRGMINTGNGQEKPAIMQIHALVLKQWLDAYSEKTAKNTLLINGVINDYSNALKSAYCLDADNLPNISDTVKGSSNAVTQINQVPVPKPFKLFSDVAHYALIEESSGPKLTDINKKAGGLGEECLKAFKGEKDYAHFFIPMPVTSEFWTLWDKNTHLKPEYSVAITPLDEDIKHSKIKVVVKIGCITFLYEYSGSNVEYVNWYDFCTAGIWPRQRIDGWNKYFMFCVEDERYRLVPDAKVEDGSITSYQIDQHRKGADGKESAGVYLKYYMLKQMPNRCQLFHGADLLGYVTVRKSDLIENSGGSHVYEAALDFGTSATTIFGRAEGKKEALVNGLNFWSMPLTNPRAAKDSDTPYFVKYFVPTVPLSPQEIMAILPGEDRELPSYKDVPNIPKLKEAIAASFPLQSILADAIDGNISRQPLAHCWVFYQAFFGKREDFSWPQLYPNLKWNQNGGTEQKRVEAMLMQLLYMIALEARCNNCNELLLTASYPLAFTKASTRAYFKSLNDALTKVAENTGLAICKPEYADRMENAGGQDDDAANNIIPITESEAAFRYAASKDTKGVTYCVIDIGGGSADIFIKTMAAEEVHSYSSSIRFGARKILLEGLLDNNGACLRQLVPAADGSIKKMYSDLDHHIDEICCNGYKKKTKNSESGIEDLLGMRTPFDKNIDTHVHNKNTYGDTYAAYCAGNDLLIGLKKRIAFYLASIIYCAGLMVRDKTDVAKDSATVVLAGNGSKMIHWLHNNPDCKTAFVSQILQAGMRAAIAPDDFICIFSKEPKLEVASGSLKSATESRAIVSQVAFSKDAESSADKTMHAVKKTYAEVAEAGENEFSELLRAYKAACAKCFDWTFKPDEYSTQIFSNTGRDRRIQNTLKKQMSKGDAYLIGAVEALSQHYLVDTASND